MTNDNPRIAPGRRSFLKTILPGGALLGLSAPCLLRALQAGEQAKPEGPKHKFLADSGMSYAEAFMVAYLPDIPIWRGLEEELGREKLHEMMKRIIDATARKEMAGYAKKAGSNDLAAFTRSFREPGSIFEKALTYEVVEDTPKAFEVKVTECLWAKTFRDANAGDLGYILSCYGDFASAEGFNPKMRMIRTKTLMQGDDCCNHRYVLEG
ncbi:MAG: L-2-amino-thiazoline-4-carboxylic acid hydrolase [Candidatus Aminicenantes bacterium]|nr:L-2-amino-thiazoline-4-carboxylic acid hydrolase [Candidatus Aminicenantes bacterium]